MIQRLFNLHQEVVTWFEPRPVWNYAAPNKKWDRLDENDASPRVIRYIRKQFLKYQNKNNGLRIMEKTPNNVVRVPYVHKIFTESKFLYIVREPLAQLSSSEIKYKRVVDWEDRRHAWMRIKQTPKTQLHYYAIRFIRQLFRAKILKAEHPRIFGVRYKEIYQDQKKMTTQEIIAKQWSYCSKQSEDDFSRINENKILRMRYEDFVADPVINFERILHHFDLTLSTEMAKEISNRVDSGRQQKWRRLDPDIIKLCIPFLKEEMQRHGYAVPDKYY